MDSLAAEARSTAPRAAANESDVAAQRRAAVSTSVSSTGWMSDGERLMTLSTSASRGLMLEGFLQLARASLYLLEQPHVFDRDDSLVREGFQRARSASR